MSTPTLFINTANVGWTPLLGTAAPLNRITQAGLAWNREVINNRADLDVYDSSAHIVGAKPTVTLAGNNVQAYLVLTMGLGAITWTIGNADTPGGAGSLVYTMTPAMNPLGDYSGPHGQYASGNLSFMGIAADGATNPVSYTTVSSGLFVGRSRASPLAVVARRPAFGLPFTPPAADTPAPPADAPADAVLVLPGVFDVGRDHFKNRCIAVAALADVLKADPDRIAMRYQGANRIYTPTPTFALRHPRGTDCAGEDRLAWHAMGDGTYRGYLTDDARQADADADAEAA
jgi:hypothetical protein